MTSMTSGLRELRTRVLMHGGRFAILWFSRSDCPFKTLIITC